MATGEVTLRNRRAPTRYVTVVLEGTRRVGEPKISMESCRTSVSLLGVSEERGRKYTAATWTGVCASGILYATGQDRLSDYEVRIQSIAGVLTTEDIDAVAASAVLATRDALQLACKAEAVIDGWERVGSQGS